VEVVILKQAERELKEAPKDVLIDIFALFDDLAVGKKLSLPISRPLPSIGKGLHELRLSGRAGEYRVFYVVKVSDGIYVIHATSKKKMSLDRQTADLLKQRMRSLNL
jgi:phage-related protein